MQKLFLSLFSFILCVLLYSCLSEEDYTLVPSARLTLSLDTLALDTIIAGASTNTYTMQVFNHTSKGVRIVKAYLDGGENSHFRVNIDGAYLSKGEVTDLEVAAGDSLRVFVEATAPEIDSDVPQDLTDFLVFRLESGVEQKVLLTASGQAVLVKTGARIASNELWEAKRPYQIMDSLVIEKGATLTLAAGTRLYLHPKASIIVYGTLLAAGTLKAPVVMRGDRLGNMFSQQPYDRTPNQWGGVVFKSSSLGNKLNYCDIHSGAFGIRCDSTESKDQKLLMENSVVHNVAGDAFYAKSCVTFIGNSQITNAKGDCVKLLGGSHRFVHCTIGQFYVFAGRRGVALRFSNYENSARLPLELASFTNCLITGYNSDDLMGEKSERYKDDAFHFNFSHCLINTPKVQSDEFIDCLFEEDASSGERGDKHFSPSFELQKLLFHFTLSAKSLAGNKADTNIARETYPLDRLGNSRLADEGADIGCYEIQVTEKR